MHAITLDLIESNPIQAKELQKILNTYKKNQGSRSYDSKHALQEFVADIFSNKTLIEELKNIQATKKLTVWDKLKQFFNNLFSGPLFSNIKEDSLMAQASEELINLLEMPVTERALGYYYEGEKINTHQESTLPNPTLDQQMKQEWTPQTIQFRANTITRIFKSIVDDLEKDLPEIEQLSTSSATRKYIITARYGSGNILNKVKQEINDTYANLDWVTEYVHEMFNEEDWTSNACQDRIDYIYQQGQKMLQYFEPLCLEASNEIKRLEGVSILTNDGEVVDLSETELLTDEEVQSKHEEGWFYNPHEQSIEETLESETVNLLSNLYETDSEGNYVNFDDLEQPIPLDFRMVLATTAKTIGSCTIDSQMLPKLKQESEKYPWMSQIIDMLMGIDTEGSRIYEGLTDEDIHWKSLSLRAIVWKDLHKIYVNIAEQTRTEDDAESNEKSVITSRIVNKREGADALMKQFEDICYNNKVLFDSKHKPYKAVYNSNGTFNESVYNSIHQEILSSKLYYDIQSLSVSEEEINLIDRALKSFGADIPIENIRKLFVPTDDTVSQQERVSKLRDVIFGFYAANQAANRPLQSVKSNTERANIFDAFRSNYTKLSEIFDDESVGFEESTGRLVVDGERKSLFSRILPNPIHTIINKLKNNDSVSETNYKARLQRDYGHNWWFASRTDDNGNGIFRLGLLKDLYEIPAVRIGLRLKSLKASMGLSQSQEIDAQAEETRLNEFENTTREIGGIKFRDYSVPTFSDKGESYFMSLQYFNIKDASQRQELINRLCDVVRQEIDRINVVEERARVNAEAIKNGLEPPIKPIACWDIEFDDEGNRVDSKKSGAYFHFFSALNDTKETFLKQYQDVSNNPIAQQQLLERAVNWAINQEFDYYLAQYNKWQVNQLPNSQHNEKKNNSSRKQLVHWIEESAKNLPLDNSQRTIIGSIVNALENDTLTNENLRKLTTTVSNIFSATSSNQQWTNEAQNYLNSVVFDTTNLDKLEDYFWNSFYANTQIIGITMRDPAFLGTPDKFQKRYAMFYSPVATCYTIDYDLSKYKETGEFVVLDANSNNSLVRTTEYSLILKDDELSEVFSIDNAKAAIEKRVVDGYLTKSQAKEIIDNLKGVIRSDAQCYRTLPSWQACLNMIGKGYNKKMQQSINRLMNPDKYGQWSYEDYHNVWEIFKPFVASYNKVTSGLNDENSQLNEQFSQIEMPTMHKNSEFLLLAMYSQLSGVMKDNWKLKAINEFMVKHGIDKIQFESAVKVGNQGTIDLNNCTTPEEIISTLEGTTGLHNDMQASEGNQQVVHSIPFRDWGISTSMPEHLLEHEESSMGTQLMKIIMEGLSETPNKIVKVNGIEKTYKQWLELYQAIEVQNLKDSFAEVGKTFNSDVELAKYLRKQILTQNKYSYELLNHLELDRNGLFKYPITDPLLRSQFDALCASLIRNSITKRMMRMGALPQVASYGFDNLQLRFNDRYGNLILTEEEFNKKGSVILTIDGNKLEFNTWKDYQRYAKDNCTTIAYMEVYLPPFDTTLMKKIDDMCIYKEDVYEDDKLIHRSGEFNEELFNIIFDKRLLNGIANRVPTETKHSMIPIRVKGFLPAQNSSCVVCPAEWIAISDSDNDGDKLYTYFYHSKGVWNTDLMKQDWAEHYNWNYINKTERDRLLEENQKFAKGTRIASSDRAKYESDDYKKSEELDMMWDAMLANKSVSKSLEEFYKQAQNNPARYFRIEPVKFKKTNIERIKGESDRDYQQRIDLYSISSNNHEARNNMQLDLMRAILQTDDNTAQMLIPGGFPIAKKVAKKMKNLMGISEDICSICNPAIRTIQQIRNMAGRNLIGIYANHRSLRPLLEQAKCTLHPDNRPTINGNTSLPKYKGRLTWSLSSEKNSKGEFISDNISNFSGASVDNAKDPLLSYLGQNEVTAPISMTLIHLGYTIDEMASFMNQPAIKECIRMYMLNGRKGFLENIAERKISELRTASANATEDRAALENLPLEILQNAIERDSQHILPDSNDSLLQLIVLENFAKILPASRALQSIISVTKADTQVGALQARSSENKVKLQTINRLIDRVKKDNYPIQGAEALVPDIKNEQDIKTAAIPHIAAFRYYGIESVAEFMGNISMTFNKLVDAVHNTAVQFIDGLSLDAETIENLTNATVSYIFSGIEEFNQDRGDIIIDAVTTLNEIKQRNLIKGNPLIKDLVVNLRGNIYSKNYPFIRLNRNKSSRTNDIYKRAWESLVINGNTEIKLKDKTITYQDLSDILLRYCFVTNGLNVGGSSFIQCFPESQIGTIKGYIDQLIKIPSSAESTALKIVDQYVANHPEDYHFVHRVGAKSIKPLLENSKVIPNTIVVKNIQLWPDLWQGIYDNSLKQTIPVAYPYIFFKDKSGRRYLYKGNTSETFDDIRYQRMQVLGNTENGFLEEYEQGKDILFGRNNSIQSALGTNSRIVLDSSIQNQIDSARQNATREGRVLTAEDYRETIEGLLGSNVQVTINLNNYQAQSEDLTGMEFCVTL